MNWPPWRKTETTTAIVPVAAPTVPLPAFRASLSGRPTYASVAGTQSILQRQFSFTFIGELYRNIPIIKESISILSGFVGEPELTGVNEAHTAELLAWRDGVMYGKVGRGVCTWLKDFLGQALLYGYAVGEAEIDKQRADVAALWSYNSPSFTFEVSPDGSIGIVQYAGGVKRTLNPETAFLSSLDPMGSEPQGQALYVAIPTVGQTWLEVLYAHRATIRRCGVPTFHINWEPGEGLNDSDGSIGATVVASAETKWNESVRSQSEEGIAKDFFSAGKVTITTIGADGQEWSIEVSKRQLVEEIVVASGVPPSLFGYAWSSTERMSRVQMDKFGSKIWGLRRLAEPALRQVLDLRERLTGRPRPYELTWNEVNLQDAVEAARAQDAEAATDLKRLEYAKGLWTLGIWDQLAVAEYVTGVAQVVTPMDEPPSVPAPLAAEPEDEEASEEEDPEEARLAKLLWGESAGVYGDEVFALGNGKCAHTH